MNNVLSKELKNYRSQIESIVKDLYHLTVNIGHKELEGTVNDLEGRIHDPFMFVIVGEVKSGKSSFINALLESEKEICKVAPSPMTDTIQQIVYGEKEEIIEINKYLKKILQPVPILKEIAIVDTPGTNTIIDHHQEITERFIPASDLIIFVFEAKNPYRQSAWEFFDFIHKEWQKKIIFILQQKDLLPPEDLAINVNGVREHAIKKGISEPNVFVVSAKDELERKYDSSGFSTVRDFIKTHITGGRAPILKLQNNIITSQNINARIEEGVDLRKRQWEADNKFRNDIRSTLDDQEKKSKTQVDILVENLIAAFDRITRKTESELSSGLSFFSLIRRSVSSIFSKKQSAEKWLNGLTEDLEKNLNHELESKLKDGVVDIADSIQQMALMIDLKLKNSKTILHDNHDLFSDIAEKRTNVLKDLQDSFAKFLTKSENFVSEDAHSEEGGIAPNLATGSGIAVIGVILTAVTNGAVFDITGGILTAVGLLFAGVSVGLQRRKIIKGFKKEIENGREQLEREVNTKLKNYIQNIKDKINENFNEFDNLLQQESEQIRELEAQQQSIHQRLEDLKIKLDDQR